MAQRTTYGFNSQGTSYDIDYEDDRFKNVERDKQAALDEAENTYGSMIEGSDKYYQEQIDASKEWAQKQQELQQENTDFAIEKIEQQKQQAEKDYKREQSGAYTDWQKQSGQYGANAEQMAAYGMGNTGYSESSQVSMYNTYQNRVAAARECYQKAVLNYDNAIKDAQLANNSLLAQIAYEALQQQLELSLQGFQYKNQLILDRMNRKQELDNIYYGRYQDVLNQMNTENALAEQVRQYNESMQYQREQDEKNYQLQLKKLAEESRQYRESSGSSGDSDNGIKKDDRKKLFLSQIEGLRTTSQRMSLVDSWYQNGEISEEEWNWFYDYYGFDRLNKKASPGSGGGSGKATRMTR